MIMLLTYRSELREQLNRMLETKSYETCIPPRRHDAVAMLEDCHPDLIVLDMYLANPSGIEVLKTMKRAAAKSAVTFTIGYGLNKS
jgi:DNA-binding response OmpR family regulator